MGACWILGDGCVVADPVGEGGGFLRSDPLAELGIGERPLELREQQLGDDELELAVAASTQDLGRGALGGQHP